MQPFLVVAFLSVVVAVALSLPMATWPLRGPDVYYFLQNLTLAWLPAAITVGIASMWRQRVDGARFWTVLLVALLPMITAFSVMQLLGDQLQGMFFDEDTVFAPQYHEMLFDQVTRGNSSQEVLTLVGPPLFTRKIGEQDCWYYSHPGTKHKNYINRTVIIEQGFVVAVVREFHTDR